MKSPMIDVATYIPADDKRNYTELQVLQSGGGFYIGTLYVHPADSDTPGLVGPGSRDSEYYATEAEAQHALATRSWTQRWTP